MSTEDPNWDTSDARAEAVAHLVRHFDGLAARGGGEIAGIERSPAMEERLAGELDMSTGRLQEAISDAMADGLLEQFVFPETLITEAGEVPAGDRHPILWVRIPDVVDPSDPGGDA